MHRSAANARTTAPPRQLISVAKAAAQCDVTTRTIYNWITSGKLRAYRTGPTLLRIDRADLDRIIQPVPHRQRWCRVEQNAAPGGRAAPRTATAATSTAS